MFLDNYSHTHMQVSVELAFLSRVAPCQENFPNENLWRYLEQVFMSKMFFLWPNH